MDSEHEDSPLTQLLRAELPRHRAPAELEARVRASLARAASKPNRSARFIVRLAAAGLVVAAASSAVTYAIVERAHQLPGPASALLAAHARSLPPGRLTDVVSTDQHNVKPWFNGRVDVSPAVPRLDSLGVTLVGGRVDSVDGHRAAVVVYRKRQHLVNVFTWPSPDAAELGPRTETIRGFQIVSWRSKGLEQRAISDLNAAELEQLVAALIRS